MFKVWLGAAGLAAISWLVTPLHAQEPCAGDCDGSEAVAINELVRCVNIVLGSADLSTCDACDVDDSGEVRVNELIAAVNAALTQCGGGGTARCGNGTVETGEECDDGNNFGGDPVAMPCSANCTFESERMGIFDPAQTTANVQSFGLLVGPLSLTGRTRCCASASRATPTPWARTARSSSKPTRSRLLSGRLSSSSNPSACWALAVRACGAWRRRPLRRWNIGIRRGGCSTKA